MNVERMWHDGFDSWWETVPWLHSPGPRSTAQLAYLAGLTDGVAMAQVVSRSMNLVDDPDELNRRLANSTIPERMAADLERVDVQA